MLVEEPVLRAEARRLLFRIPGGGLEIDLLGVGMSGLPPRKTTDDVFVRRSRERRASQMERSVALALVFLPPDLLNSSIIRHIYLVSHAAILSMICILALLLAFAASGLPARSSLNV